MIQSKHWLVRKLWFYLIQKKDVSFLYSNSLSMFFKTILAGQPLWKVLNEEKKSFSSWHCVDMALVIISMARVVCQLASLCKLRGCRRRLLAGPVCEKQTHLVKFHPHYLIRWCNEGEGFFFFCCLQASGCVLDRGDVSGAVWDRKPDEITEVEKKYCAGGHNLSTEKIKSWHT